MPSIKEFKDQFRNRQGIHLNSAGQSPISIRVLDRVRATADLQARRASMADPELVANLVRARSRIAGFLGADPNAFAFAPNVASAISQVALGFPLTAGDRVVTIDQEYSSQFYPWKVACERSGAELKVVSSDAHARVNTDQLLDSIRPGVKMVSVSWVQFKTGSILDLRALGEHCHSVGAFLAVDGIQALGQLPFDFNSLPVDFIAGAAHKWMASLLGQGFFAVKPELMKHLKPLQIGAGTFSGWGRDSDPLATMVATASRFEPGGLAFAALFGLDSAVELLMETGMTEIEAEIARFSKVLREGILGLGIPLSTPKDQRGGITSFRLDPDRESRFLGSCRDSGIAIMKRGDFIRISPHAFNEDSEMERVLEVLKESAS
jgi:cysteine desulfurase/selenocysteine lyase